MNGPNNQIDYAADEHEFIEGAWHELGVALALIERQYAELRIKEMEDKIKEEKRNLSFLEDCVIPDLLYAAGIGASGYEIPQGSRIGKFFDLDDPERSIKKITNGHDLKVRINNNESDTRRAHEFILSKGLMPIEKVKTKIVSAIHAGSLKAAMRRYVDQIESEGGDIPAEAERLFGLYRKPKVEVKFR